MQRNLQDILYPTWEKIYGNVHLKVEHPVKPMNIQQRKSVEQLPATIVESSWIRKVMTTIYAIEFVCYFNCISVLVYLFIDAATLCSRFYFFEAEKWKEHLMSLWYQRAWGGSHSVAQDLVCKYSTSQLGSTTDLCEHKCTRVQKWRKIENDKFEESIIVSGKLFQSAYVATRLWRRTWWRSRNTVWFTNCPTMGQRFIHGTSKTSHNTITGERVLLLSLVCLGQFELPLQAQ